MPAIWNENGIIRIKNICIYSVTYMFICEKFDMSTFNKKQLMGFANVQKSNEINLHSDVTQSRIEDMVTHFEVYDSQFHLASDMNVWIIKPVGLSQGRGMY